MLEYDCWITSSAEHIVDSNEQIMKSTPLLFMIFYGVYSYRIHHPARNFVLHLSPSRSPTILNNPSLLLRTEPRSTNITSSQLDTQDLLHARENLLVRHSRSSLEISHDALGGIALRCQILLCHLGLHLLSLVGDCSTNFLPDSIGLDDII